jgi:hypothetical protein
LGGIRTNARSITTGIAGHLVPGAGSSYYAHGGPFTNAGIDLVASGYPSAPRITETGQLQGARRAATGTAVNGYASFDCPPASYYNGLCTIRSGTTLRRVIGDRMKLLPNNWELSNGLIRVTPASTATLQLELWNGAAWEGAKTFWFGTTTNFMSPNGTFIGISVLRNSPEFCSIRVSIGPTDLNASPSFDAYFFDISIQRGRWSVSIHEEVYKRTTAGGTTALGCTSATASTALTGGIRATSNDAAGNRYVMGAASFGGGGGNDLTQGAISATSVQSAEFMLGFEFNGSSAASGNTAQDVLDEWYYALDERMVPRTR